MRTVRIKVYKFDELSKPAQEKVIEDLYDINTAEDWWNYIYEDAKNVHIDVSSFNLQHGVCKIQFLDKPIKTASSIIVNHGEMCYTYKLAKAYLRDWISDGLDEQFRLSLQREYLRMLRAEFEYLQSEEAIVETIKANDYEFTGDGEFYKPKS